MDTAPSSHSKRLKILIVDSGKVTRNIIASEFPSSQFEVKELANVEEAGRLAMKEEFDLITLGIHLEGGTGFDLCRRIRGFEKDSRKYASSSARILFVTSDFTERNRIHAHDSGADGFIEKSVDLALFKASIAAILQDLLQENSYKMEFRQKNRPLTNRKILIVDDSELNLVLFRRLLESQGAEIQTAISAEHALRILEENPHKVSAIFSDLYMPNMNGDEFCRIIQSKAEFFGMKLGITTAADESSLSDPFPEGVRIFSKPYKIEEIVSFLTEF
ncbi:response regulator [Leptospira wolffii]|uniref:response regulator n=1 Tax=Leptospira wolffii TaxID=409998 RepID=UPI00108311F8|nr:response regulator [Leptospira wolffii]TGL54199.1 response regulator [Leptospira wolffii]